jgi:hypothetical protein
VGAIFFEAGFLGGALAYAFTAPTNLSWGEFIRGAAGNGMTLGVIAGSVAFGGETLYMSGALASAVGLPAAALASVQSCASQAPEVADEEELTGTALARKLGDEGEIAANIVKNTEQIPSLTGTAAYRIPDALNHATKVIGEVKNVASLSYSSQLRDFAMYAQLHGYQFELFVRPTTVLSGPLQAEIANGNIILQYLP